MVLFKKLTEKSVTCERFILAIHRLNPIVFCVQWRLELKMRHFNDPHMLGNVVVECKHPFGEA